MIYLEQTDSGATGCVSIYLVGTAPRRVRLAPGETITTMAKRVCHDEFPIDLVSAWYLNGERAPDDTILTDGMVLYATP